ncbi:unnamed protein product [Orchesella dallaii]|uniref:Uncharacterized protein n=1 Tax=Orchesella dallaii TaxID=48710 RepID=A0ABP1RMX4_9HEXA
MAGIENESASASSNINNPPVADSNLPNSSGLVKLATLNSLEFMPQHNGSLNLDEESLSSDEEDDPTIEQLELTHFSIDAMITSLRHTFVNKMEGLVDSQKNSKEQISNLKQQLVSAKKQEAQFQIEWKGFATAFPKMVAHVDSGSISQNLYNMKKNLEVACLTGTSEGDNVDEMATTQNAVVEIIDPVEHNRQYIALYRIYESTKKRGLQLKEKRAAIQERIQSLNQQIEQHKLELFKTRVNLLQLASQIGNYDQPIKSAVAGPSQGKRKRLEEPIPEDNEEIQVLRGENSELEQLENQGKCEGESRSGEQLAPEVPEDEAGVDSDEVMDEGNPPLQNQENGDAEPEQVAFPPPVPNEEVNPGASNQEEDTESTARPPPLNIVEEQAQVLPVAKSAPKKWCRLCGENYTGAFKRHVRKYCKKTNTKGRCKKD